MTDPRHPDEDQLLDLALGHAPTPERDRTTAHLATCVPCRRAYADLADSVQLVLPVAPRISPPPEFDADVLAALARVGDRRARGGEPSVRGGDLSARPSPGAESVTAAADREVAPVTGPARVSIRRRAVRLAVAAGLVGLAVGAGVTAGVLDRDEPAPITANQDGTPLLDSGGAPVGAVAHARDDDGPVLIVRIDEGPAGYEYTCRLVLPDGRTRDMGHWRLGGEGPARWVVPVPDEGVAAVQMVSRDGTVWSTAEF